MTAIDVIRLIAPEFGELSDDALMQFIMITRPMVSRARFGELYTQALAYLVCHRLKMAGYGAESPLGDIGAIGVGFAVGSVSEGGSSVSFGASQSSNLATDAELGLTVYGVQYLQIRRSVIVPIHCSGESVENPADYDDSEYTATPLPIASATVLGGVRVQEGSGLEIDENGVLSVAAPTASEQEEVENGG